MASLTVDKTELSRLISCRRALPDGLVVAVGPAPKAGRRRWMELTERLQSDDGEKKWSRVTNDPSFGQLDSDSRFLAVFAALSQKAALAKKTSWIDHRGQKIARVDDETGWLRINVDKSVDADFGAFLVNQLPTLLKAYQANRDAAEL